MITVEKLREWGAAVDEGLARCMNNESFYLMLVGKSLEGDQIDDLEAALSEKDLTRAFEAAHALKGVCGNLALTPLFKPVSEMTELLRAGADADYSALFAEAKAQWTRLKELAG